MITPISRTIRLAAGGFMLLIVVVLLFFFSYVRLYLPNQIRTFLIGYASQHRVALDIEDISFHLPSGFVLSHVSVSTTSKYDSDEMVFERLTIVPNFIQSYITHSVIIDRVELRNGRIKIGNNVFRLLEKGFHKKKEAHNTTVTSQKNFRIDIKEIVAEGIDISFEKRKKIYRLERLSGTVADSGGRVEAVMGMWKASFEFKIDNLNKKGFLNSRIIIPQGIKDTGFLNIPSPSMLSLLDFNFEDEIKIFGKSYLFGKNLDEKDKLFAEAGFEIVYSDARDAVELKGFRFSVNNAIDLSAFASVVNVRSNPYLELEANFRIKDLGHCYQLFWANQNTDVSGSLSSERIRVEGFIRPRDIKLFGILNLEEVSYQNKDSGIEVGSLNGKYRIEEGKVSKEGTQISIATFENGFFESKVLGFSDVRFLDVAGLAELKFLGKNRFYIVLKNTSAKLSGKNVKYITSSTGKKTTESKGSDIYFKKLFFDFGTYKEKDEKINGTVSAEEIRYGEFEIDWVSSQLTYTRDSILLENFHLRSKDRVRLDSDILEIVGKDVYHLKFWNSNIELLGLNIAFKGMDGDIELSTENGVKIIGKVEAESSRLSTLRLTSVSSNFFYTGNQLAITSLTAGIFGGVLDMKGSLEIGSNNRKVVKLALSLADISGFDSLNFFSIENARFKFDGFLDRKNRPFGKGAIDVDGFRIERNERVSTIDAKADMDVSGENIVISEGKVSGTGGYDISFDGKIHDLFGENRSSHFFFHPFPIRNLATLVSPLLPPWIIEGRLKGTASVGINTFNLFQELTNWGGSIRLKEVGFEGMVSGTRLLVEGVNGTASLKEHSIYKKVLDELMSGKLTLSEDVFYGYKKVFVSESSKDYGVDKLQIRNIRFGFLEFSDLSCIFELDREKLNIIHLYSRLYEGDMYAKGVFWYKKKRKERYNISVLIDNVSLKSVVQSLPFQGNYITGIVYGLAWFSGGEGYFDVDGVFSFWTKDGKREKRTIGKDLLRKLGAKGTFFTGTSRRYNKGVIAGYIKGGFITFKEFEISNKILFHRDLFIGVDPKMNSISLKHLLSVIREISRRVSEGEIKIKKKED